MTSLTLSTLPKDILYSLSIYLEPRDQMKFCVTSKLFQSIISRIYWQQYTKTPELQEYTSNAEQLFKPGDFFNRMLWVFQQVKSKVGVIVQKKVLQAIHADAPHLAQICQAIAVAKFILAIREFGEPVSLLHDLVKVWSQNSLECVIKRAKTCQKSKVYQKFTQMTLRHDTLRHGHVGDLPPLIGRCTRLDRFDVGRNDLLKLPAEIGQLTRLRHFDCSRNKLTSLPSEIGQLTRLTHLDCSGNSLTSLPSKIGLLTQLTYLDCSGNSLTSLPSKIGLLTQLTSLTCQNNKLTSLFSEIGLLTQLKHLDCQNNKLTSLFSEIGLLTRLTHLDCSGNKLIVLPPEIVQLAQLMTFGCSGNQLTHLPYAINQLTQLTAFDCSNNQLTHLPYAISLMRTQFMYFDHSGNKSTVLPYEIDPLTAPEENSIAISENSLRLTKEKKHMIEHLENTDLSHPESHVNKKRKLEENNPISTSSSSSTASFG